MKHIYVDIDGVLADFEGYWIKQYGSYDFCRDKFKLLIEQDRVFTKLNKTRNCDLLVEYLKSVKKNFPVKISILSSSGTKRTNLRQQVIEQKTEWLTKNIDFEFDSLNFVTCKPEKANYATNNSFLIDDMPGCVEPFIQAGGSAVLHRDDAILCTLSQIISFISYKDYIVNTCRKTY